MKTKIGSIPAADQSRREGCAAVQVKVVPLNYRRLASRQTRQFGRWSGWSRNSVRYVRVIAIHEDTGTVAGSPSR
jgi:hypothetical protein